MNRLTAALVFLCVSFGASAARYEQITTSVLDNDANGIAEDQTLVGAGNLTINGTLASGGVATLNEAQIVALESTGNLSGVTFTITGTDADGVTINEDVTGPNNTTVKSTQYFRTITQIAADGAVGTNVEVGTLAADGMVTRSVIADERQTPFNMSLSVELSAGTGTFGVQYTLDNDNATYSDSYSVNANWRDAVSLDPDINTASGEDNIIAPVRAVRGLVTTGSTTGVYKFTFMQGNSR